MEKDHLHFLAVSILSLGHQDLLDGFGRFVHLLELGLTIESPSFKIKCSIHRLPQTGFPDNVNLVSEMWVYVLFFSKEG